MTMLARHRKMRVRTGTMMANKFVLRLTAGVILDRTLSQPAYGRRLTVAAPRVMRRVA